MVTKVNQSLKNSILCGDPGGVCLQRKELSAKVSQKRRYWVGFWKIRKHFPGTARAGARGGHSWQNCSMCEDLRIGIPWQWKTARVKWLRLCTSTARGTGLNPGQGTKISHTMWNIKKKKKKKKKRPKDTQSMALLWREKYPPLSLLGSGSWT